jgi:hypothetical protein
MKACGRKLLSLFNLLLQNFCIVAAEMNGKLDYYSQSIGREPRASRIHSVNIWIAIDLLIA